MRIPEHEKYTTSIRMDPFPPIREGLEHPRDVVRSETRNPLAENEDPNCLVALPRKKQPLSTGTFRWLFLYTLGHQK